jgi:pSer/pThr/pTyr-binding forkhead associated (FHA) protein
MNKPKEKSISKNGNYLHKLGSDRTNKKIAEGPRWETRSDSIPFGVLFAQGKGLGFLIREKVVVIGRKYDCDYRIEKPYVSQVHAVISLENGSLVLEDLGGRYGTRVNRIPVERKILLDGDRIRIGQTELVFKASR